MKENKKEALNTLKRIFPKFNVLDYLETPKEINEYIDLIVKDVLDLQDQVKKLRQQLNQDCDNCEYSYSDDGFFVDCAQKDENKKLKEEIKELKEKLERKELSKIVNKTFEDAIAKYPKLKLKLKRIKELAQYECDSCTDCTKNKDYKDICVYYEILQIAGSEE